MKASAVFVLLSILLFGEVDGKIKNGYEPRLQECKESLQRLHLLLKEDLPWVQRRNVESTVADLLDYIAYWEITEELLSQLRTFSHELYDEIDNIKDNRGRSTDVYVSLIPKRQATLDLEGAAYFKQAPIDEDANMSEYGEYTVSVKIWVVSNAVRLLYHELGHVKYVVPNLATYTSFYERQYRSRNVHTEYYGHSFGDQSGIVAMAYEKRYRTDYARYLKDGGPSLVSAPVLLKMIRKSNEDLTIPTPLPSASNIVFFRSALEHEEIHADP